jgi:nitronate monooxygenase
MPLPTSFEGRLSLPAVAAPMFLVSGPEIVKETCKAGVVGTFPALNNRTTEGFDEWLTEIETDLAAWEKETGQLAAPYGVNLIVHGSNPRVQADLEVIVKHKTPLVITSLGAVAELVEAVHSYGGVVFHDVTNMRHARSAMRANVDGLILVCNGAGGHAGTLNPFAFLPEVRAEFDGTILMAGCISDGWGIAGARAMGADLAYLGTRFINTAESNAPADFKTMITEANAGDIVYTPAVSGVPGSFLRQSIEGAGLDPDNLPTKKEIDFGKELTPESQSHKAWKNVWSAGQGVGTIDDMPPVADLVSRLKSEYEEAVSSLVSGK